MKKDSRIFGYSHMKYVDKKNYNFYPPKVEQYTDDPIESKNPNDSLLSIIYAADARTGLPTGDLGYYVSDKANPEIKAFIQQNLMRDVSQMKTIPVPDGLTDKDLDLLSRQPDEDVSVYAERLNDFVSKHKDFMSKLQKSGESK